MKCFKRNMYNMNDQKPEISLLEDTELAMQGQLWQKGKVKVERDGVLTAQGCLSLPTCKLFGFPFLGKVECTQPLIF